MAVSFVPRLRRKNGHPASEQVPRGCGMLEGFPKGHSRGQLESSGHKRRWRGQEEEEGRETETVEDEKAKLKLC